jgi:hypothetical protein
MLLTLDVPDNLTQQVIDFVNALKLKHTQNSHVKLVIPEDTVSGLLLSEQSLAKDWLNDDEDEAWAHLQSAK